MIFDKLKMIVYKYIDNHMTVEVIHHLCLIHKYSYLFVDITRIDFYDTIEQHSSSIDVDFGDNKRLSSISICIFPNWLKDFFSLYIEFEIGGQSVTTYLRFNTKKSKSTALIKQRKWLEIATTFETK